MASQLGKYSLSIGSQPLGVANDNARAFESRAIANEDLEIGRAQRLGRRAYRDALRNKDYGKAMQALDWVSERTGSSGAGISIAGNQQRALGDRLQQTKGLFGQGLEGDALTQPSQPMDASNPGMPGAIADAAAPGVMQTQPNLLNQRQELFQRMIGAGPVGAERLRGEAAGLGIDSNSWLRGVAKASQFNTDGTLFKTPPTNAAQPTPPQTVFPRKGILRDQASLLGRGSRVDIGSTYY